MTSIPPLLPTLREHQRYVTYHVRTEAPLRATEVMMALRQSLLAFLGEAGYGEAGVQFVEGTETGGILRTNSHSLDKVKSGLMMATRAQGKRIAVSSVSVSGMIHKARSRAL